MNQIIEQTKQVEGYWNAKPCDSDRSARAVGSRAFFLEIEHDRYSHQWHIKELLESIDWSGKRVLEIGTGVGTDSRFIASHGGLYCGINIDQRSSEVTRAALQVFGLEGTVRQMSATAMEFPDHSFDVVYSFGVLHHIPDVMTAMMEIKRVLKPGGVLLIMLYNRSSINYYLEIMFLRRAFRRILLVPGAIAALVALGFPRDKLERHRQLCGRRMTPEEWLSRNTDGPDNPYSRVYNARETRKLLRGFNIAYQRTYFFDQRHWGFVGRLLPRFIAHFLGRCLGWHRVVYAINSIN